MTARATILGALVLLGGSAQAAPTSYRFVAEGGAGGPTFMRQEIPASATTTTSSGLAKSRTIYLNRAGATLTPGKNNSQANTSTVVSQLSQVPGWAASTADWTETVACMKEVWSRFAVTVTDVDPGATPHIEAIFARSPADVGITESIGGISPFTTDCAVIESSIVFAFTDNLPKRPRAICEVMSQEVAHSYGLDHELLSSDPMTYLARTGNREFQDQAVSCGESTARPCGISGSVCRDSQNSFALLGARVGVANRDNQPPSVGITAPADSATVSAGFAITATASDNVSIRAVAFYVDGELAATRTAAPYALETDPALAAGYHTIVVEATDADGNTATEQRDVVIAAPAPVAPAAADPFASVGCAAGRAAPSGWLAVALVALGLRRRRARSAVVGGPTSPNARR